MGAERKGRRRRVIRVVARQRADAARSHVLAADRKAARARTMADIALYLTTRKRSPDRPTES
jgi:hypothetical protein